MVSPSPKLEHTRTSPTGKFFGLCNLTQLATTAQRCRPESEKNILQDLFSSVLSQFKKYHLSGILKFNNLGIFQSLKLRNLMGKILRISRKRNFTPNTVMG